MRNEAEAGRKSKGGDKSRRGIMRRQDVMLASLEVGYRKGRGSWGRGEPAAGGWGEEGEE